PCRRRARSRRGLQRERRETEFADVHVHGLRDRRHERVTPLSDERVRTAGAAAVLVTIVAVSYGGALRAGFVGDDFMILHRLRALTGPADVLRFFRGEFFEYYRPLGFVAQAMDWTLSGSAAPR